jgi:GNAT superfamily N-acetyltransferase
MVPALAADDSALVSEITDLVNRVYAAAERGLWLEGATRTTEAEVAGLIRAEQIAVSQMDGRLVGSVRVQELDGGQAELGMLVAAPQLRGIGIGRELMRFAEGWARTRGLAQMQLELLVPRTWSHPVKEFLKRWYERIGYRAIRVGRLDEAYPLLVPQLATPCDFIIYHKELVTASTSDASP